MGKLTSDYKKSTIFNIIDGITANTESYYAFASHHIPFTGNTPAVSDSEYFYRFEVIDQMMFGKKLANTDFVPMTLNAKWVANTVYTMFDNTSNSVYANNDYYAVVSPITEGGPYNVFKCIYNANGAPSTVKPDQVQLGSFTKSDGYKWRYMYSISEASYSKFATDVYVPVYTNTTISTQASNNSGIEVIKITNTGSGYSTWSNGIVQSIITPNTLLISANSSLDNQFYTGCSIYIYNTYSSTAQLRKITNYTSNSLGNYVGLDTPANTTNISNGVTSYIISPSVNITGDGVATAKAYCTINATSNSIGSIIIVDPGYGYTWANVSISGNTNYGTGAAAYPIIPFEGGHGIDPVRELNVVGYCTSFTFANTDNLPYGVSYKTIGIAKNPYTANTVLNVANTLVSKSTKYNGNSFSQIINANLSPSAVFSNNDTVIGQSSGARGRIAFTNSSVIYLTGDKNFINGEYITSSSGLTTTQITINTSSDIYSKDLDILYVQNIDGVTRSNTQSESFKIIIQV